MRPVVAGRMALDRGCAVSLASLASLRLVQFLALRPEVFYSAAGQLKYCFLYVTPQSLVCCAFVPLFAPCGTGLLRHMLTEHVVVRRDVRKKVVTALVPRLLVRSLAYSAALVVTGLLVVFLRSGFTFPPVGYASFALINIVLEIAFFCACGLLMAAVYLLMRSIALSVCAMALYGAADYLVSFVAKRGDAALCVGWGLTIVGPEFDVIMGLMGLARLIVIVLVLLFLCLMLVKKEDLLGDDRLHREGTLDSGNEDRLFRMPPIRRSALVRLAVCVGVQVCSTLYLSQYGCVRVIEYLLAECAFVPQEPGQIGLLVFIAALLPVAAFLYCFSGFVKSGLGREGKYVLPRFGSRMQWSVGILIELLLFSCAFVGLGSLASVVALLPFGAMQHMGEVGLVVTHALPLVLLLTTALACAANLLCLAFDALTASAMVIVAHAGTLLLLALVPSALSMPLVRTLPSSQGVLAWHDCGAWSETLTRGIPGFEALWSGLYLALLTAALGLLVGRSILRSDVF